MIKIHPTTWFLSIALPLFAAVVCVAQSLPPDSAFYTPIIGPGTMTINPSAGTGDDTLDFNDAINALSPGGGVVTVSAGTYRLLNVQLKSNVHLRIDSGATLVPFNPPIGPNSRVFDADENNGLENFSIEGTGGRFTIDMTGIGPGINLRSVLFQNASNFRVSDLDILDSQTVHSSLTFGGNFVMPGGTIQSVRGVPNHGIIENVSVSNAHYGYGLTQVQAGNNLLFRNLSAIDGGVALRLETGFDPMQYATGDNLEAIRVDEIWGREIAATNGHAALNLSPHTIDQGRVDVSGVTSVSNSIGVEWSAGFTTSEQALAGLTPGSYASNSKIRDVEVTFGQSAQLHPSKHNRNIPCQLRLPRVNGEGLAAALNPDGVGRLGPSVAAVLTHADRPGHYDIDFPESEVTAHGFNETEHYLPPNAFVRDSFDDFEESNGAGECTEVVPGVSFFVPSEYRNTPNRWLPRDQSGDGDDDHDVDGPDFLTWQRGQGNLGYWFDGDFDGSGTVDGLDLGQWQANYGASSAFASSHVVPEPSSMLLCFAAIALICCRFHCYFK